MDSQAAGAEVLAALAESPLLRDNRTNVWAARQGNGLLLDIIREAGQQGFISHPSSEQQHQKSSIPHAQAFGKTLADVRASPFPQSTPARSRHQPPIPVMSQVFSATLTALHTIHNNNSTRRSPQPSNTAHTQLRTHLKPGLASSRAQGSNSHAHMQPQGTHAATSQLAESQRTSHEAHMLPVHAATAQPPSAHRPAHCAPASTGPTRNGGTPGQSGCHPSLFVGRGSSRWHALTSGERRSLPTPTSGTATGSAAASGAVRADAGARVLHSHGMPQDSSSVAAAAGAHVLNDNGVRKGERAPPARRSSAPLIPAPACAAPAQEGCWSGDGEAHRKRRSGFTPSAKEVLACVREEAEIQLPEDAFAALAVAAAVDEFASGLSLEDKGEAEELMECVHSLESQLSSSFALALDGNEPPECECEPAPLDL